NIKEAKQVAKEYDEVIQEGHGAFLLEEHLPDIFQCSVELTHGTESESIRFVFLIAITPRYGSSGYSSAKKLIPDKMSYSDKINLAEQITHLEKDSYAFYGDQLCYAYFSTKVVINEIMSELIFVIDRSGSMEGEPIKKVSEAFQLLLHSLPEDCLFNVSQPYSEGSFSKALKHAQEMITNYGGIEIYNPLKWAFENSRNNMPTFIFLLIYGQVYKVDQISELFKSNEEKKKDNLRFFSIRIGDSISNNLVESASRA
ncbi:46039_t:CDS:2, partial [Gigaspora margarita]